MFQFSQSSLKGAVGTVELLSEFKDGLADLEGSFT